MEKSNTYKRKIRHPIRSGMIPILLLIIFFGISMIFDPLLFAQVEYSVEEDFYYSNGQKVSISVSKTSIGLLVKDTVTAEQIKALSDSLELMLLYEYTGGIFVFSIKDTLPRMALVQLAREIKSAGERLIAQTGLVITPAGAETPLIGSDEFIVKFLPNVQREEIDAFNQANAVEIISANPFVPNQFLVRVTEESRFDVLQMANRYHENILTEFSHPNFIPVTIPAAVKIPSNVYSNAAEKL